MGRCRFVQPETVRIYLADVAKRAQVLLIEQANDPKHEPKVTSADLAVASERVTLAVADGDYIDVKKTLTAGETRAIFADLVLDMEAGKPARLDAQKVGTTKLAQYITGWSFIDADGRPVEFTPAALDTLDAETYRELDEAITQHEAANEEARKNARSAGLTLSRAI